MQEKQSLHADSQVFLCHGLQSKKRGILVLVSLYVLGCVQKTNIGLVGRA